MHGQLDRGVYSNGTSTSRGALEPSARKRSEPAEPPRNSVLTQISTALLSKIRLHLKTVRLDYGDYLYRPDEEIEYVYFPETAVMSEFLILDDGRTIEVSITGREGMIGALEVYSGRKTSNWLQVAAAGTAFKLKRDEFRLEFLSTQSASRVLHDQIGSYVTQVSQKVACNAHHTVEERFCTWLLMLQDRCSSDALRLTQEHIARVLGVYRPSVTCIAQGLRDSGAIDYVRGHIYIRDRNKLKKLSCCCYSEFSVNGQPDALTAAFAKTTARAVL
jgi:CRP-like cAMP-binding protein